MDIMTLLNAAVVRGASDVLLTTASPAIVRIHGALEPLDEGVSLTAADLDQTLLRLASPEQRKAFEQNLELDFSFYLSNGGRARCNVGRQKGGVCLAIRLLPAVIPNIDQLGLPGLCRDLILRPRGLIIVSGPTGSGKSTTLAAMVQYLNLNQKRHVVTIEDPIEYVYADAKCVIAQRELGVDTLSFAEALRHVLRQNPDVIMVGEMRDAETAAAVLNVAETGHLVLTTGHAPSAPQVIERVTDLFPISERNLAQTRLASLLLAVMCQALVPKADGSGRIAAIEVMLANPPVRNLIREGKLHQLPSVIRTQAQLGMVTLDQALLNLYYEKTISFETVLAFCNDQDEMEKVTGNTRTGRPEPRRFLVKDKKN
jgi:twitching motility protein PilT